MARAERPRGTCSVCDKPNCAITDEGGVRHHFTEDPALQAGPDSRKCRGVGQPPKEAGPKQASGSLRFLCRVPSGPGGCGHQVQLTANHRARTHLTPQGTPCPDGSSAFPIAVDVDGFRADTADWTEDQWKAYDRENGAEESVSAPVTPVSGDFDPRDPEGPGELPTASARPGEPGFDPAEVWHREDTNTTAYSDGSVWQGRRPADLPHDAQGGAFTALLQDAVGNDLGTVAGEIRRIKTLPPEERAEAADALFDVTHPATEGSQTVLHPGEAAECRSQECCKHPRGFLWADDGNGHEGSFCPVCGAEEPEPDPVSWKMSAEDLADFPEDIRCLAETNPECWFCRHEITPIVEKFGPDGKPEIVVWNCWDTCYHNRGTKGTHYGQWCRPQLPEEDHLGNVAVGACFRRHTAMAPLNRLVYRVTSTGDEHRDVVVVSPGVHHGRTGQLTQLMEEITWTDQEGRPRPRPTSGREAAGPQSYPLPTPSRPVPPTQPTPAPARGSRPVSTASAPAAATGTSKRATASGPTGTAASRPRSAQVPDAFSTAKQAKSESDRYDRYGRYKMKHPHTDKPVAWTRATTAAKSIQDTFALSQWAQRMTLKGAALREDIVSAALTLDVKQDKDRMNALVEDAKKAAGVKVAANLGTALHSFTEDRDKVLVGEPVEPREVPEKLLPIVDAYDALLAEFGLLPVPGLIEFTTAVLQYEWAGTSDRCYLVTRDITFKLKGREVTLYAGEYVIGDVKSGATLDYGWMEICIQLAIYAQGFNSCGVWDWNTGTWGKPVSPKDPEVQIKVRTDVGLIPHLPVDRKEGAPLAALYAVDLDFGWATAVLCGQVRAARKEGNIATLLTVADVAEDTTPPSPVQEAAHRVRNVVTRPATLEEKARAVTTQAGASAIWKEAVAARTPKAEVDRLVRIMKVKLESFVEKGA